MGQRAGSNKAARAFVHAQRQEEHPVIASPPNAQEEQCVATQAETPQQQLVRE